MKNTNIKIFRKTVEEWGKYDSPTLRAKLRDLRRSKQTNFVKVQEQAIWTALRLAQGKQVVTKASELMQQHQPAHVKNLPTKENHYDKYIYI